MDEFEILKALIKDGDVWLVFLFFMLTAAARFVTAFFAYRDGNRTRQKLIEETKLARELNAQVVDRLLTMVENQKAPRVIPVFHDKKEDKKSE
jgi:hypothetical protein